MRQITSMLLATTLIFLTLWTASASPRLAKDELSEFDCNEDGLLNHRDLDYATLQALFGEGHRPTLETLRFDFNCDFVLDVEDLQLLLHQIATVGDYDPEPGILVSCELGDFNFIEGVTIEDFNLLVAFYLAFDPFSVSKASYYDGDCNGDDSVDVNDYEILKKNWHTGPENAPDWPF